MVTLSPGCRGIDIGNPMFLYGCYGKWKETTSRIWIQQVLIITGTSIGRWLLSTSTSDYDIGERIEDFISISNENISESESCDHIMLEMSVLSILLQPALIQLLMKCKGRVGPMIFADKREDLAGQYWSRAGMVSP